MTNYSIFKQSNWPFKKYDGRKKYFRGISKDEFTKCCEKRLKRLTNHMQTENSNHNNGFEKRRKLIEFFKNVPFKYEGDGLDDFNSYQKPSRDGVGYVSVCPGERGNNVYVDDPILVSYLKKKYDKYWKDNN